MGHAKDGTLQCDGWCKQTGAVTHIDEKGYAYCTPCGIQRKHSHRCRKLTPRELKTITSGGQIAYYKPRKVAPPMPDPVVWTWGEDRFSDGYTPAALAESIAESIVCDLDNDGTSTVTGPDGAEYRIVVTVTLTPARTIECGACGKETAPIVGKPAVCPCGTLLTTDA